MGNTQGPQSSKRERTESSGGGGGGGIAGRRGTSSADDDCINIGGLEMKFGTGRGSPNNSMHSMQFENASEYPVVVKYTGNAKNVTLSGSWDGWRRKIPLVKSQDDFTTIINLPEGRHEFKFNVDGRWICDHNLPRTCADASGVQSPTAGSPPVSGESNVIVIDKGDFEVFDALDKDLQATSGGGSGGTGGDGSDGRGNDLDKTYSQEVPDKRVFEKTAQPPVLPPHLLQVILNKDTPIACDPNVLPEPNHVMLNHLYALSIKDGVMVLSATHRYRKKYVTTLLYKPI